jgi:hypothetical protein
MEYVSDTTGKKWLEAQGKHDTLVQVQELEGRMLIVSKGEDVVELNSLPCKINPISFPFRDGVCPSLTFHFQL